MHCPLLNAVEFIVACLLGLGKQNKGGREPLLSPAPSTLAAQQLRPRLRRRWPVTAGQETVSQSVSTSTHQELGHLGQQPGNQRLAQRNEGCR